jgi:hypothetical protein
MPPRNGLVVGDPDRASLIFSEHLGVVAIETSPEEPAQEAALGGSQRGR